LMSSTLPGDGHKPLYIRGLAPDTGGAEKCVDLKKLTV